MILPFALFVVGSGGIGEQIEQDEKEKNKPYLMGGWDVYCLSDYAHTNYYDVYDLI